MREHSEKGQGVLCGFFKVRHTEISEKDGRKMKDMNGLRPTYDCPMPWLISVSAKPKDILNHNPSPRVSLSRDRALRKCVIYSRLNKVHAHSEN